MSPPDPALYVPVSRLYGSVARLLRGAALVLALLFVLRVLLALAPLRSGPLPLVLSVCDALVGQAPFAVLVVCLLGLSVLIDEHCRSNRRLAHSLRSAAIPVAIGYLLLIPLYGSAQWWRARSEATTLRRGLESSLQQLQSTRQGVVRASSSADLQRIWTALPAGSPPLSRFGPDLPRQRRALLRFLDQVNAILRERLLGVERRLLLGVVRNTGLYALACLALAALFYRSSQLDLPALRRRRRLGQPMDPAPSQPARDEHLDHELDDELERRLIEGGIVEADGLNEIPPDLRAHLRGQSGGPSSRDPAG